MSTTGIIALSTVAFVEGLAAIDRDRTRVRLYHEAQNRAIETGRLFVVIGDPNGGATKGTGCGDICVDINDCSGCSVSIAHDLTIGQIPGIANNSAIVYVSCVLEYVSNYQKAWSEILRIAGSEDNIFVVNVQPWTFTAALYPGAKHTISPVEINGLTETHVRPSYIANNVSTLRKVASVGVIAGLLFWAFVPNK